MTHTELYFAIRNYLLLGIVGGAVCLVIWLIIASILDNLSLTRKFRYLKKIGFERYLISVASAGNHCDWGWRRIKADGSWKIVSDTEVAKNSLTSLKKKYTE